MNVQPIELPGVLLIDPVVHRDPREFFLETYQQCHYIELHGGTLTLASEMGVGTTVTIALPRPSVAAIAPTISSSTL